MALTLGTSHAATGTGSVAISQPAGLRVAFTTIPAFLAADPGTPHEYYGLGRVNVGNAWGFLPHVDVVCTPQVVLGLPPGLTLVAWDFAPGVVGTIQELVESPAVTALQPWDRSFQAWGTVAGADLSGGGVDNTAYTYTVPAGRFLLIQTARAECQRLTVASAYSYGCWTQIYAGPSCIASAQFIGGPQFNRVVDALGGQVIVSAGATVTVKHGSYDTGGSTRHIAHLNGYLFNA